MLLPCASRPYNRLWQYADQESQGFVWQSGNRLGIKEALKLIEEHLGSL
jgi:hypothetical protein